MENSIGYLNDNNNDCEIERSGKNQRAMLVVDPQNSAPSIGQSTLALLRPASDTGLPGGNMNMIGDYSVTNKDFYVEALSGERLAVHRAIVHIHVSSNVLVPSTYGNVTDTYVINGIFLIYERSGVILNALDGLPLKKQEDWGRLCFDSGPVGPYGAAANQFPFWQVRLSFDKFAGPRGIILEEGDRLGVRLRDDFTAGGTNPMIEHYIYFEGEHIGIPNTAWQNVILPL
jgi:hypothetical protein